MFEILKIKLFGLQPTSKVSDDLLDKIIKRDFKRNANIASAKLRNLHGGNRENKNRVSADILKLANKDINALDGLIEMANIDIRDVIMLAEYPRCAKIGFRELDKKTMKKVYIHDFIEYSNWLNKRD